MARVKSSVVINNIVEVFNNEESNENKLVDFVSHVHLNADLSAIWIANGIKVAKKTNGQQFQKTVLTLLKPLVDTVVIR